MMGGCKSKPQTMGYDANQPLALSLWTYYSGKQLDRFNDLVQSFNEGPGKKQGIRVEAFSPGSMQDLQRTLISAVEKEAGAPKVPHMFLAYADIAKTMDTMGIVADLSSFLTEEEKQSYIAGYLQEGAISKPGELKVFPIAKATEVMVVNMTDWNKFAQATGSQISDFSTIEGLVDVARRYYEWTDSLTETPDDGKAFFGRDALANYFLIGAKQLGMEIVSQKPDGSLMLRFDEDIVRKLWDSYYIPYLNGYFSSMGHFRSDDMKTGNVIAFVGSSSGVSFAPRSVSLEDSTCYPITTRVFPAPGFKDGIPVAVQQGAGVVVTQSSAQEIQASVAFLKWFTQPEQNTRFALSVGYMPVKKSAMEHLKNLDVPVQAIILETLQISMESALTHEMYTPKPVKNGTKIRRILEESLSGQAIKDRAQVLELMQSGLSRKEAVARFATNDHFHAWYAQILKELEALS